MNYRSIIQNFRELSAEQLARLKSTLSLSMSTEMLAYCSAHYDKHERRDPCVDELRMLDALSSTLSEESGTLAINELLTNEDYIAHTYADLLKKRKALDPKANHPCTIRELSQIASLYLFRAGYSSPLRASTMIPEYVEDATPLIGGDSVTVSDARFYIRLLPFASATPCKGDLLVLLSPKDHEPFPTFHKNVELFLKSAQLKPYLKAAFNVRKGGLLRELLEITNHLWIDLSAFSSLHIPMPMTVLTEQYRGCRILRISENGIHAVPRLLREREIDGFIFAQITDDGRFTFSRERDDRFSIHPQFMRRLFDYRPSTAKITDEAAAPRLPIRHRTVTAQNSAYLSANFRAKLDDAVERNGLCCSAASSNAENAFFKSALHTVLAPIATLCAFGIDYADQQLSVGLTLPKQLHSPDKTGECIAQILGLYRAQAELSLPAQAVTICEAACEHPSITAFSVACGKALPSRFSKSGSNVYCVSPRVDGQMLPDFDSLRRLLERITALGRQGAILSMRLLCGESITSGLREMSDKFGYRLTEDSIASEAALDFALLLESDVELELSRVATTTPAVTASPNRMAALPDISCALNRCQTTQVILLSKKFDSDALSLASMLEGRGARVKCFFNEQSALPSFARALLTSQVLILCRSVTLPKDARVSFALDTLQRAGGCVLSFNADDDPSFFQLHDGIDEEIFLKICKKTQNY